MHFLTVFKCIRYSGMLPCCLRSKVATKDREKKSSSIFCTGWKGSAYYYSLLKKYLNYHTRLPVVFSKSSSQCPGNSGSDLLVKAMALGQQIEMTSSASMWEMLKMSAEVPYFLPFGCQLSQLIQSISSNIQSTTADIKWSGSCWAQANLLATCSVGG